MQSVNAGLMLEAASSSAAAAIPPPPPPPAVAMLDRERLEARLDGLRVAVEEEEEENGVQVRSVVAGVRRRPEVQVAGHCCLQP